MRTSSWVVFSIPSRSEKAPAWEYWCVYMDPPYGIKFGSNWQVSTRKKNVKDGKDDDYTRQPEQVKAFRDTWELGIHSYLSYLRDRLIVARELLTESGSCFVQISEENVHLLRNMMDEVFGSNNFISMISYTTTSGFTSNYLSRAGDYILWYGRNKDVLKYRQLFNPKANPLDDRESRYNQIELSDGLVRPLTLEEKTGVSELPENSKIFTVGAMDSQGSNGEDTPYDFEGKTYRPATGRHWTCVYPGGINNLAIANRLIVQGKNLSFKRYYDDFPYQSINNLWTDIGGSVMSRSDPKIYVVQTGTGAVQRCLLMTTDPGDLVLDPTCGSGTTAYVAEQWGRRWITTDTSRVALALARTRLMTAKYPYYTTRNKENMKEGFEYKTIPHITLKSLANNEPAEQEVLYDQPREEKSIVRVSGPFTVESLSPHRISAGVELLSSEDYVHTVIENLRRAGVSTGVKDGGISFENLDAITDSEGMLQAAGESKNADGKILRIAVAIGPEYGSVDDDMIRDAVKQAAKYYDMLVVAAPAFEGSAFTEENNPFKLRVVKVKINPDLSMGDLLKKTGSGNLFMAIGEPDIAIHDEKDGKISVEVKGVDVYDAIHGDIRSSSVDDIACWFIDTNYNEEAFFVTHAYFTGAEKPYDKLKKALRAEINEEVWESLYTAKSRPFIKPKTGKIAIKVINHFGDEVMKIKEIS